jgi:Ca2+ insensitive EF hand
LKPYVTELDLHQSLIPAQLIDHLADIMPKDASGEGYDYDAFLDILVNGGGKEISNGREQRTSAKENTLKGPNEVGNGTRSGIRNERESPLRESDNASNVSTLAVAEGEEWGNAGSGSMARRSRHYL